MNKLRYALLTCITSWSLIAGTLVADESQRKEHRVRPGEDPQAALDRAAPGDRIVLLPGLHIRPLGRHRSLLYVDKPIDIELADGAILRLADHQTTLLPDPEITTDHSAKTIDDLEVGGKYDLSRGHLLLTITIDNEGGDDADDTFRWAYGVFGEPVASGIPITGDWQPLAYGIQVRFQNKRGHNKRAFWFVSYDGRESYGIRIGHGTQQEYIENVRVGGRGTIDLNRQANTQPSVMVKNISACVLVHGRVRDVLIEDITMVNTMRSVMLYGEHTGKFLPGGGVGEGESFDAENITIQSTRTINPEGAAYLLGHPSHRGRLTGVRCNYNTMLSATTSLEPNFNLDRYEVIGNLIQSDGLAVHCWRRSTNGRVLDNVRIGDDQERPVVVNNAPSGWQVSEHLEFGGNFNLQQGPLPADFAATADEAPGHFALRGTSSDAQWITLQASDPQRLAVSGERDLKYRLVVLARSDDGRQYAAFSAAGRIDVRKGVLADARIVPASRSSDALLPRVRYDAEQNRLVVEARGLDNTTLTWVGRGEIGVAR